MPASQSDLCRAQIKTEIDCSLEYPDLYYPMHIVTSEKPFNVKTGVIDSRVNEFHVITILNDLDGS